VGPHGLVWEVILVNSDSTGNTESVAKEHVKDLPIIYAYGRMPGLSRVRNTGLDLVSGDIMLFTDDGTKAVRGRIETYWLAYEEESEASSLVGILGMNLSQRMLTELPIRLGQRSYLSDDGKELMGEEPEKRIDT